MRLPTLLDEIDRLFDELVRRPWGGPSQASAASMRAVEGGWVIEIPSEGLRPQDLRIEVQGRRLVVTGHVHRHGERREATRWGRMEEEVSLHRTILLPEGADVAGIQSTVTGGKLVLRVRRKKT